MKYCILLIVAILTPAALAGQGSGIGYTFDVGGSLWSQASPDYHQIMGAYTHNGFIRTHNERGNRAFLLNVGYKTEYTSFQNTSEFLAPDGGQMMNFATDATIERTSWKFGMIEEYQFGSPPGGFLLFSINTGVYYEYTASAKRYSDTDYLHYDLVQELNPHGFGYTFGAEVRLYIFTFGYKVEQLFRDVLDHDYIPGQTLQVGNSSELRGLMMHPMMHYVYVGVNFDMFRKGSQ